MVSHAVGARVAEHWRCEHGAMVIRVRSQRAYRCTALPYRQATRSDQLSTIVELIVARRGHIVDRAPRSLDRPPFYRETRDFLRIHSCSEARTCSHLTRRGDGGAPKAPASALVPPTAPLNRWVRVRERESHSL
jgi:hypothetical protein